MLPSPLDDVVFAYEPVWDKSRRIGASRLHIQSVRAVDIVGLLGSLTEGFAHDAPPLLLAVDEPRLLLALLKQAPVRNTWLEVPEALWAQPSTLELIAVARRYGHQLLWRGARARFEPYAKRFAGLRGVLELSAEDALQALQSAAQGGEFSIPAHVARIDSPILAGHLYVGVSSRALADHALDRKGAWGVVGWPEDELLTAKPHAAVGMDLRVIQQVQQAADADAPIQTLVALVAQDPVMVYRLLRMVNSAAFGLAHEVTSIRHALMMLGYDQLARWLDASRGGATSDRSWHPLRHAMGMRARLMRLLLPAQSDEVVASEVHLTGVLARLDQLLKEPLASLLQQLPLPGRVTASVLRHDGPYVPYLEVAEAVSAPHRLAEVAAVCARCGFSLDEVNRAVIQLLASARYPADLSFARRRGLGG